MSTMSRRTALVTLAGTARLGARDTEFWNRKEPAKWSEREIDRLLTKSPWAKEVEIALAGASQSDGNAIGAIGGILFPGRTRRRGPTLMCVVRWESAAPVIEAMQSPLPRVFDGHYAISVNGLPRQLGDRAPEGDDAALDALIARLKQTTYLRAAGREAVQPELVQLVPGVTTRGFLFGFRRESIPLSAENGSVVFQVTMEGGVRLRTVYYLREMSYGGRAGCMSQHSGRGANVGARFSGRGGVQSARPG